MKDQDYHYHARTRYKPTGGIDFVRIIEDLNKVKQKSGLSLNVHLPFEIQHPGAYPDLRLGLSFIRFAEGAKKIFEVPLYWENAPELNYGVWDMACGQTDWNHVSRDIDLTLDTGHLMLGSSSVDEAKDRIEHVIFERKSQIKHMHIHENDLVHDEHWSIGKVITPPFLNRITQGVTFIFEKGESIAGENPRHGEWIIE